MDIYLAVMNFFLNLISYSTQKWFFFYDDNFAYLLLAFFLNPHDLITYFLSPWMKKINWWFSTLYTSVLVLFLVYLFSFIIFFSVKNIEEEIRNYWNILRSKLIPVYNACITFFQHSLIFMSFLSFLRLESLDAKSSDSPIGIL